MCLMVRREVGGCTVRCMVSSPTPETSFKVTWDVCECCGSSLESVAVGYWYGWVGGCTR